MSDQPLVAQKAPFPVELEAGKSYYWCACGKSKNQPFCDGSHKSTSFEPVKYTCEQSGRKFLCGCKMTNRQPFCDGTHKEL
ncbi:MAG: CDGSH iron-sulfur domain-containing protein [Rhizobiales bacterium]|nr:CDGSH iron-sulfur domain-containing protein [Hyphomicrobiales bacterium]